MRIAAILFRHALVAGLAAALPLAATAADVLPPHLTGSWGTAESLYAGHTGQSMLHLEADGLGIMAGSTPPPQRISGADDGKPPPRAVIGFPVRATLDGTTLTMRPVALNPKDMEKVAHIVITCTLDTAGERLTCASPRKPGQAMGRLSAAVPEEMARMLTQVRGQLPWTLKPPAASRYRRPVLPVWLPAHSA